MKRRKFLAASLLGTPAVGAGFAEQDLSRWEPSGCITDVEGINCALLHLRAKAYSDL